MEKTKNKNQHAAWVIESVNKSKLLQLLLFLVQ